VAIGDLLPLEPLLLLECDGKLLTSFLRLALSVPHGGVQAVRRHQVRMRSLFDEVALLQHQNEVGMHDGR
jgi:hypothetical protein